MNGKGSSILVVIEPKPTERKWRMNNMLNNVTKVYMDLYSQKYDGIKDKFTKTPNIA